MLDLRGVSLPGRDEIAAERARRRQGAAADWLLLAGEEMREAGVFFRWNEEVRAVLPDEASAVVLAAPELSHLRRRCQIRAALGLEPPLRLVDGYWQVVWLKVGGRMVTAGAFHHCIAAVGPRSGGGRGSARAWRTRS